jgi:exosome complex component CSL4
MSIASLSVGSVVVCQVDKVQTQRAEVTILAHEKDGGEIEVLIYTVRGQIRLQDARSFDIDKAAMTDHFIPGDIVRAHLMSVGDMKSCFLSTVGPKFGVVEAKDDEGNKLSPVDHSHMRNEHGKLFKRKTAQPVWMTNTSF